MITPIDIGGDEDAARAVLTYARGSLAPCLDDLFDEDRENAMAILRRAASRATEIVSLTKTRTAGPWTATMFSPAEAGSAFVADDREALRGLCGLASVEKATGPLGCFPDPPSAFRA